MYPDDFTVVTMGSPILWDGLVLPDTLPAGLPQPDTLFDDDIVDRDRLRTHPHQELARLREVYGPDAVWWSDNAGNPVAYLPEVGIGYLDFDSRMPGSVDEAMGGHEAAGIAVGSVLGGLLGVFFTGGAAAVPARLAGGVVGAYLDNRSVNCSLVVALTPAALRSAHTRMESTLR